MKNIDGVEAVDYNLTREDFTRHGQHINAAGKTKVVNAITKILTQPSINKDKKLIPMKCIDTISDPAHLRSMTEALHEETAHRNDKQEVEVETETDRLSSQTCPQQKLSNRRKKTPLTKTEDFLWG
jgi:hypothetical protein